MEGRLKWHSTRPTDKNSRQHKYLIWNYNMLLLFPDLAFLVWENRVCWQQSLLSKHNFMSQSSETTGCKGKDEKGSRRNGIHTYYISFGKRVFIDDGRLLEDEKRKLILKRKRVTVVARDTLIIVYFYYSCHVNVCFISFYAIKLNMYEVDKVQTNLCFNKILTKRNLECLTHTHPIFRFYDDFREFCLNFTKNLWWPSQ